VLGLRTRNGMERRPDDFLRGFGWIRRWGAPVVR
jgi:hypothetical protein